MSGPANVWPSRDAYQNAVLNPERNLRDPRLKNAVVGKLKMGMLELPHPRSGNFGAVYKFAAPGNAYAVKVFDKAQPDRQVRYAMVDRHLASHPSSAHLVTLNYDPQGIQVAAQWYPTLLMDWVEGPTLDAHMEQCLRSGTFQNGRLCRAFCDLMQALAARQIAHGDLQHGNILVLGDGSLKLVDYDGMFVPEMRNAGLTATEIGLPAYQHPKRFRGYFDSRLDSFSALVILLTLASATWDLWERYPPDENCLIVRESDLIRPDQSELFRDLAASPDRAISKLAAILKRASQGGLDQIPVFSDLLGDGDIRATLDPRWRPVQPTQQRRAASPACAATNQSSKNVTPGLNTISNPTATATAAAAAHVSPVTAAPVNPPSPATPTAPSAEGGFLSEMKEMATCVVVWVFIIGGLGLAAWIFRVVRQMFFPGQAPHP